MINIRLQNVRASEVFSTVVGNLDKFGFSVKEFPETMANTSQGKSDYHKVRLTRYIKEARVYEAEEHEFYNHRFNKEGFRQRESTLYRIDAGERVPVIVARDYSSWETSMQDSVDEERLCTQTFSFEKDGSFLDSIVEGLVA